MCLAVPMIIEKLEENNSAIVSMAGISHKVNISLVENPQVGDHVIIHAGYAIEKLNTAEAEARLSLFRKLAKIKKESF